MDVGGEEGVGRGRGFVSLDESLVEKDRGVS